MDLSKTLSDSVSLVGALIKVIEDGVAKHQGDGLVGNVEDVVVEMIGSDAFKAAVSSLVKDMIG